MMGFIKPGQNLENAAKTPRKRVDSLFWILMGWVRYSQPLAKVPQENGERWWEMVEMNQSDSSTERALHNKRRQVDSGQEQLSEPMEDSQRLHP